MTVFEKIKMMDVNELAEYLNEHWIHDDDPSMEWWDKTYCKNCEPVVGRYKDFDRDAEFAYCELHDKCRFFQDMDDVPDCEQMLKMWLESEV